MWKPRFQVADIVGSSRKTCCDNLFNNHRQTTPTVLMQSLNNAFVFGVEGKNQMAAVVVTLYVHLQEQRWH